jgi:hypothetical protein
LVQFLKYSKQASLINASLFKIRALYKQLA